VVWRRFNIQLLARAAANVGRFGLQRPKSSKGDSRREGGFEQGQPSG
jgi:hypothetical protein